MNKKKVQATLITAMSDGADNIDDIEGFIMSTITKDEITMSCGGNMSHHMSMIKCILDRITEDLTVEEYSYFALELTAYIRRLMEKRYRSDSELKEK